MLHIYTKYNDDTFGICSVITKKDHFSFIREYKRTILRSSRDVIDDVITMKTFFLHNLGRPFNIWCQIEASLNISKIFKMTKF